MTSFLFLLVFFLVFFMLLCKPKSTFTPAFKKSECSLVGNQKNEDTGKKAGHGFMASEMVTFRWIKMADAGNTGTAHVLRRDFSCDDQIKLARHGLHQYFPNDPSTVRNIWNQHKIYMALDKKGEFFYNADGKKKRTCNLKGSDQGCSGADWSFGLDYPYDTELGDLRTFTMKFLGRKAQQDIFGLLGRPAEDYIPASAQNTEQMQALRRVEKCNDQLLIPDIQIRVRTRRCTSGRWKRFCLVETTSSDELWVRRNSQRGGLGISRGKVAKTRHVSA